MYIMKLLIAQNPHNTSITATQHIVCYDDSVRIFGFNDIHHSTLYDHLLQLEL